MTPPPASVAPPEAPAPAWRGWIVWTAFYAAIALTLCRPWHDTRVPAAADVGEREFSAERAFVHVDALAGKLGRRVAGTEAAARAADYVETELRRLGVETVRQVASGTTVFRGATIVYRDVINVLARVPGKRPEAILVSAHYDSAAESPGAGDNALAVAAVLEIVRALRGTGPLENTLIFNVNGGEEAGLLGAAAFVHHPWFADVVRFINLDASGGQGRQLLFQASPGSQDLVEAYAASVPHVHGTVLAQEIFSALPFDTDYHVYRDAGLIGLDLAPYTDNYAYHSALDRPERTSRRTLQESGENLLALLRNLPAQEPSGSGARAPVTPYYDLLGLVMVRYSSGTALVLGLLVAALALALALWPDRRAKRPLALLALGAGGVALSTLFALAAPIAFAVLVMLAGRSMSWFARPWLAALVYGVLSLAGVLAAQRLLRWRAVRRGLATSDVVAALERGLVVCWAALLALTTALGIGAAYLPLWWCAGCTIALVASSRLRRSARWAATLAGLAVAALTTAQAAHLLLTSLVPLSGTLGPDAPVEVLIASVTALALAPFTVLLAPLIQASPMRPVGAGLAVAAVAAIGLVAFSFPFTEERPKHLYVEVHASADAAPHVVFEAIDPGPGPGPRPELAAGPGPGPRPELAAAPGPGPRPELAAAPPAPPLAQPMPTIEVAPGAPPGSVDVRLVAAGAYLVDVRLEGRTAGWSLGDGAADARHLLWIGTTAPLSFRVDKATGSPVAIRLKAYYLGSELALALAPGLQQLPGWVLPDVQTVLEASASL